MRHEHSSTSTSSSSHHDHRQNGSATTTTTISTSTTATAGATPAISAASSITSCQQHIPPDTLSSCNSGDKVDIANESDMVVPSSVNEQRQAEEEEEHNNMVISTKDTNCGAVHVDGTNVDGHGGGKGKDGGEGELEGCSSGVKEEKGDVGRGNNEGGDDSKKEEENMITCVELQRLLTIWQHSKGGGGEYCEEFCGTRYMIVDVRSMLCSAWQKICNAMNYPYSLFEKDETVIFKQVVECLEKGGDVIIYDAGSTKVGDAFAKAGVVVNKLKEKLMCKGVNGVKRVRMLKGGFGRFMVECPGLVEVDCGDRVKELMRRKLGARVAAWGDVVDSVSVAAGFPAKVLPYLMVGSARNAGNRKLLESLGVTHCLVVGDELKAYFPGRFTYKQLFVRDLESESLEHEFRSICDWLDRVREKSDQGARVLIHCHAGVSRSVTCAIAYLIWLGYGLKEAMALIKEKRRGAAPNRGFLNQLQSWELTCMGI